MFLPPAERGLKGFRTLEGVGLSLGKNSACHETWQCYLCYLFLVLLLQCSLTYSLTDINFSYNK